MKLATPNGRQTAIGAIVGIVTLALPLVFHVEHHFPWDDIPGFYAIYGAVGCGALVVVSKWVGRVLLVKPPDWWGEESGPDEDRA